MAGLSADTPHPTGITVHTQSRVLEIAFADGNIDKYEENLIRRVSDLIYVSHSDFIRAKISARDQGKATKES